MTALGRALLAAVLVFLYAPVLVMIAMAFNASELYALPLVPTLHWFEALAGNDRLIGAARNSVGIALLTAGLATALGTLAALALSRRSFRGRTLLRVLLLPPIAIPWLITGTAMLVFFFWTGIGRGLHAMVIGHVALAIPYVVLVVGSGLGALQGDLEDAAKSLGATPFTAFRTVTLPLLAPSLVAAALFAFAVSLDQFVISYFLATPGVTTLPVEIYTAIRKGFTPEINAASTILLAASVALFALFAALTKPGDAGVNGVEVAGLRKGFGGPPVLDGIDARFEAGRFTSLLGPSGSGKTTLLRVIGGFVPPDAGRVRIDGADVTGEPLWRRRIGMVFQSYALFPHMSVADNVAYGLRRRGTRGAAARAEVARALELVHLTGLDERRPKQLSGGQQQRVALARAIVTKPRVLLLDEPLSALDRKLRQSMQVELKRIQRDSGLTTIFVTHDQEEALALSDRVAILDRGRIVQEGEPAAVYERPGTRFAATFLGDANLFQGIVRAGGVQVTELRLLTADPLPSEGEAVTLAVRPEKMTLLTGPAPEGANVLAATVRDVVYAGATSTVLLDGPGGIALTLLAQNRDASAVRPRDAVRLAWSPAHTVVLRGVTVLRHATIPPERAWFTWSDRPAEMVFLPLGVRLTPLAYAASTGRATLFPPGEAVRFGTHDLQARQVALDLTHAGTTLAWRYRKPDPFRIVGRWDATVLGEWGLRFWVTLCLSAEDGTPVRFDADAGAATVKIGSRFVALVSAEPPVQVTGHADVGAVAADYEAHGYFHLASRAEVAPVLALRFNLEMSRANRFALAVADRGDLAVAQARAALDAPDESLPAHTGRHAGALDAIRDVMAWNTVWDRVNARPYTSISRNWNQAKFGGFGVWLDDQLYHAAMTGLLDPEVGRENLAAALASATPQGNLACLVTAADAWVDRTQLPVASVLAWGMAQRGGGAALLHGMRPALERNHAWWWANRDPGARGLCSYGTSDVGEGLYKGTSFGARNESSMDNAPIHDEARYDPATRTLDGLDVGLNSLLALDAEMLGRIAAELGDASAARRHAARAEATRRAIRTELWDDARGLFANRLWSGAFVRSVGPTSFYPLVAGVPTAAQTERLLGHLADHATFAGPVVIPGVARNDPAFGDNSYWRGRVWPPLNYWVWQGLRRAGRLEEAAALAGRSMALFMTAWDRRLCPENYNATTGEPLDQPDTEGFYGWGALLPLMGVGEITDVTPWEGWTVTHTGEDVALGPLATPAGLLRLEASGGRLALIRGGETVLATTLRGRLARLRLEDGRCSFDLRDPQDAGAVLYLPGLSADRLLFAQSGSADLRAEDAEGGLGLTGFGAGAVDIRWASSVER